MAGSTGASGGASGTPDSASSPEAATPSAKSAARGKGRNWLDKLPSDIFGSDVFVDYQGSYVWQANQFGHFLIGFVPASALAWTVAALGGDATIRLLGTDLVYWLGGAVFVLYAVKEYIDLLIAERQAMGLFPYAKSELWADMAADTWFVASGILTALAAHWQAEYGLLMLAISAGAFLILGLVFLPAKKSLDRTALPYLFRLANFPQTKDIRDHNVKRIRAFIAGRQVDGYAPSPAVLIQGYRGTGKTTLAIGIGTEVAVRKGPKGKHGKSSYLTAFGLFEKGAKKGKGEAEPIARRKPWMLGTGDPWSLAEAEYLIIDDVDSDSERYGGHTPDKIIEHITSNTEVRDLLMGGRKTVWVTGGGEFKNEQAARGWRAWLVALTALYGLDPPEHDRKGDTPADIRAREPIPVIWLEQPIKAG